jgi:hypothetical protein
MKCDKCGYSDNGSGDWAHICGPVEVKKTGMNPRLRQFEKESKLEIFGIGAKRIPWEAALEKYAELIVKECATRSAELGQPEIGKGLMKHFGVEE